MAKLKYIGGILPALPSNRFINSVFIDVELNQYYIQEENNDIIVAFKEIDASQIIVPAKSQLYAGEDDKFIYTFISYSKDKIEIVYGDMETIQFDLLALLSSDSLNVHSKLLISSFLSLYSKTLALIEDSNKDFEDKGIEQRIKQNIVFASRSYEDNLGVNIIELIYQRYKSYKKISKTIEIDDIAFIKDDLAYFKNNYTSIKSIINKNTLKNDASNKLVSEIITKCTQKQMVNIKKISLISEVYEFLLESEYVIIEQKVIEQYLSEIVKENKLNENESILDIGINVDKEIYNSTDKENFMVRNTQNEKDLLETVKEIIATDSNS